MEGTRKVETLFHKSSEFTSWRWQWKQVCVAEVFVLGFQFLDDWAPEKVIDLYPLFVIAGWTFAFRGSILFVLSLRHNCRFKLNFPNGKSGQDVLHIFEDLHSSASI